MQKLFSACRSSLGRLAFFALLAGQTLREEARIYLDRFLRRRPLVPLLILYCLLLAVLKKEGWLDRISEHDPARFAGRAGAITGVISRHPDPRMSGCVYMIETETIELFDDRRDFRSISGGLLLHVVRSTVPVAAPGDRIRFIGRIQRPPPVRIPGSFDYESYLENHGVHALVYASSSSLSVLGPAGRYRWLRTGWRIKQSVVSIFERHLGSEEAAVLAGLTVGVRPRFHAEIKRIFRESGTMHVLVASGSNVAFIAGIWFLIFRFLGRFPKRYSLLAALIPLWIYVIVVGCDPPITRAGLMATVGIVAYWLLREDRPFYALVVAAFVILAASPRSLFDVGFQMSFLTVFGLIHFLPFLEARLQGRPAWLAWTARLTGATFTAQLWLLPITANVFHQFFPIGLLSNIVVLPLAVLGLPAGLFLTITDSLSSLKAAEPVHKIWVLLIQGYLEGFIALARFFADHPGKIIWMAPLNAYVVTGFYLACLTIFHARKFWLSRVGLLFALGFIYFGFYGREKTDHREKSLSITWIDMGRKLSCLIQAPDGETVLINPGKDEPSNNTERLLLPFLAWNGIRSLDAVLITDDKPEDVTGLGTLGRSMAIGKIIFCSGTREKMPGIPTRKRLPVITWEKDRRYKTGTLEWELLPDSKLGEPALLMRYGPKKILFDEVVSLTTQNELLARGTCLSLLQARFSPRIRWRADFVKRHRPELLVEIGSGGQKSPSEPPWNVRTMKPQATGWFRWESGL